MNHIAEEELIAYQLREPVDVAGIREHLEACPECARLAESIAETLRVFSAEPVPQANLEHAWQRLRGSLPPVASLPATARRRNWGWAWLAVPALATALVGGVVATHMHPTSLRRGATATLGPGPLTAQPRDADLAAHLDSAERLLTEVSHSSGPLDETTRRETHDLLLTNAVYIRKADADGDVADAAVLEDLSRTLTTLEHESGSDKADDGWHLNFEMNAHGLLLDLRILQQNDRATAKDDAQ